jgi:AcrR family transcriptional regulator
MPAETPPTPPEVQLGTRARILDAALACFLEAGYEQTTSTRICERSGVSNGTLFHHFRTKEAIADALYVDAMASFQEGLWQLIRSDSPKSLHSAVRDTIAHQAEWVEANVDLARFVYTRGTLDAGSAGGDELEAMNVVLAAAYEAWLDPFVRDGQVRDASMLVLVAIVTGPTHAIARRWLAGQTPQPLSAYVDELADAACGALLPSTRPTRARRRAPVARRGRVRIELLAEDGRVMGEGEATTEISPPRAERSRTAGGH